MYNLIAKKCTIRFGDYKCVTIGYIKVLLSVSYTVRLIRYYL